jgi:hypothetical protein
VAICLRRCVTILAEKSQNSKCDLSWKWLTEPDKSDFLHQYEISLSMRSDNLFDEILEIADSIELGETITTKAGGQEGIGYNTAGLG